IVELLTALNREEGATVVLVTHEQDLAGRAQRLLRLADGVVVEDRERAGVGAGAAGGATGGATGEPAGGTAGDSAAGAGAPA
ncbi:MAG: hypothetical protein ACYC7F_13960, partial [Gemmatimonadaceae bacterium]